MSSTGWNNEVPSVFPPLSCLKSGELQLPTAFSVSFCCHRVTNPRHHSRCNCISLFPLRPICMYSTSIMLMRTGTALFRVYSTVLYCSGCAGTAQCSAAPHYSGCTGAVQYRPLRVWSEAPSSSYSEPPLSEFGARPPLEFKQGPLLNLERGPPLRVGARTSPPS